MENTRRHVSSLFLRRYNIRHENLLQSFETPVSAAVVCIRCFFGILNFLLIFFLLFHAYVCRSVGWLVGRLLYSKRIKNKVKARNCIGLQSSGAMSPRSREYCVKVCLSAPCHTESNRTKHTHDVKKNVWNVC